MIEVHGTNFYCLSDLLALKEEYLATKDDSREEETYCTYRELAAGELTNFFGWLNIRNNTP